MDEQFRSFMLDFIPLTDCIHEQNATFADVLQRSALDALFAEEVLLLRALERLRVLLRLASDLGYIDIDVLRYLELQLRRIADATERGVV